MVNSSRTGRRPGESSTREGILAAARARFASRGFKGTTIRGVAEAAGVDPALVTHYFGSKQGLFDASLELPFDPATVFPAIVAGPPASMGERLVRFFLATWSAEAKATTLPALVRTMLTEPAAAHALERLLVREGLGPALAAQDLDEPEFRATLAASQLCGMGLMRFILKLEPMASEPEERIVAALAPVVQGYLTEPLPRLEGVSP